jgi:hypothetical protein
MLSAIIGLLLLIILGLGAWYFFFSEDDEMDIIDSVPLEPPPASSLCSAVKHKTQSDLLQDLSHKQTQGYEVYVRAINSDQVLETLETLQDGQHAAVTFKDGMCMGRYGLTAESPPFIDPSLPPVIPSPPFNPGPSSASRAIARRRGLGQRIPDSHKAKYRGCGSGACR